MTTIGVVGMGFVGRAVARGFSTLAHCEIRCYDTDPLRSMHTLDNVLGCDFVFVCLPTPMVSAEGGHCDIRIIDSFFANQARTGPIYVLKSTVSVGTTRRLGSVSGCQIVHNPEFLTERSADLDFVTSTRIILGAIHPQWMGELSGLYQSRFPGIEILWMEPEESEFVKYATNAFLASKVALFNEFRLIADALKLDWNVVHDSILSDGRIAKTHADVPGPDGQWGFGGKCFPKDLNALIATAEAAEVEPHILRAVWMQNCAVRADRDWTRIPGAVSEPIATDADVAGVEAVALAGIRPYQQAPHF